MTNKLYKINAEVYKDSYTEGEGENVNNYDLECTNIEELENELDINIEELEKDEEQKCFFISKLVNNDNYEPSEWELEEWKKGELELYVTQYRIEAFDIVPTMQLEK